MGLRTGALAAALLASLTLAGASNAAPVAVPFSGSCQFAGPISPSPGITAVPQQGAHFSYLGSGTCAGTLGRAQVAKAPIKVTFTNVSTVFDTCELGPDFNLAGVARIGAGKQRARFKVTINLGRLALVGPFELHDPGRRRGIRDRTVCARELLDRASAVRIRWYQRGVAVRELPDDIRASRTSDPVSAARRPAPRHPRSPRRHHKTPKKHRRPGKHVRPRS